MSEHYPFPLPEGVADRINKPGMPVWKRYSTSCLDENDGPTAIRVLAGWFYLFEDMLQVVWRLFDNGLDDDENPIKRNVYRLLDIMRQDLELIVDLASATLPFDPWILRHVQKAIVEHPEMFPTKADDSTTEAQRSEDDTEGEEPIEDDDEPCDDASESDQLPTAVIPLKRAAPEQQAPAGE